MDEWISAARSIAATVPSLDSRPLWSHGDLGRTLNVEVQGLPARRRLDCCRGVNMGGEDTAWLGMDYD